MPSAQWHHFWVGLGGQHLVVAVPEGTGTGAVLAPHGGALLALKHHEKASACCRQRSCSPAATKHSHPQTSSCVQPLLLVLGKQTRCQEHAWVLTSSPHVERAQQHPEGTEPPAWSPRVPGGLAQPVSLRAMEQPLPLRKLPWG